MSFAPPTAQTLPEKMLDAMFNESTAAETNVLSMYLYEQYASRGLSQFGLDARLTGTKLAEALTLSLLDGKGPSCNQRAVA